MKVKKFWNIKELIKSSIRMNKCTQPTNRGLRRKMKLYEDYRGFKIDENYKNII